MLAYKSETIYSIGDATIVCDMRQFVGIINCYRDIWYTISPNWIIIHWGKVEMEWFGENDFIKMKKLVGKYVLQLYINFNENFRIYTNARKHSSGEYLSKMGIPLCFPIKFNPY